MWTHEALGVFTDDGHVDGARVVILDALDGPDVRVQVHLLPERDDRARVPLDFVTRTRDRAEHGRGAVRLERGDRLAREGGAGLLEVFEAGVERDKGRLRDAGDGFEHALRGLRAHISSSARLKGFQ